MIQGPLKYQAPLLDSTLVFLLVGFGAVGIFGVEARTSRRFHLLTVGEDLMAIGGRQKRGMDSKCGPWVPMDSLVVPEMTRIFATVRKQRPNHRLALTPQGAGQHSRSVTH
jgi:hypothetical protein